MPNIAYTRERIRMAIDVSKPNTRFSDVLTAATPAFWRGVDIQFEVALFWGSELIDMTNYSNVFMLVNSADKVSDTLMSSDDSEAGPPAVNSALTKEEWLLGGEDDCHAKFVFTWEETDIGTGDEGFWLVVAGITNDSPGRKVTFGATTVQVLEDGTLGTPAAVVGDPDYYTAVQSDARYAQLAGAVFTGNVAFSGTNNLGLKLNTLTTTQRDALTAANGHTLYNSTTTRFETYEGGAWHGHVRLDGDTMTGLLTLSAGPSSGLHATTKTYVDAADGLKVNKATDTMTGELSFSGTNHYGIKLNTLTTTQRNALTPANGHTIYNSTTTRFETYEAAGWHGHVRLDGDTMTGLLTLSGAPSSNLHAATKLYVDSALSGFGVYMNTDASNILDPTLWRIDNSGFPSVAFFHCDPLGGDDYLPSGVSADPQVVESFNGAVNPGMISRIGAPETLTSKTIAAAILSGTFTGTATFAGTMSHTSPTITGIVAGAAAYLSPVIRNLDGRIHYLADEEEATLTLFKSIGGHATVGTAVIEINNTDSGGSYAIDFNFGLYRADASTWSTNTETVMRLGDHQTLFNSALVAIRGVALGVASLDTSGKVPLIQLPDSIVGQVEYQGTWDATANLPTIPAADSTNKGHYYIVATAGTTPLNGISEWAIGDWLISNGATWGKVDNTDSVSSVFGRTGAIIAVSGDYTTTLVTEGSNLYYTDTRVRACVLTGIDVATPGSVSSSDTVLSGIGKLQASKLALSGGSLTGNLLSGTDNTNTIGSSTFKFSTINCGTGFKVWNGTSSSQAVTLACSADGVLTLSNYTGSTIDRICLGLATASFPAIKRSSAALLFRLGDDSADASFTAAAGTFSGAFTSALNLSGSAETSAAEFAASWNTTGNPILIKANLTNGSGGSLVAGATAKFIDLQDNGVSKFSVSKAGVCKATYFSLVGFDGNTYNLKIIDDGSGTPTLDWMS